MKILLIEDSETDIDAFESTVKTHNLSAEIKVTFDVAKTIEEAFSKLVNDYHGIVVDLKLAVNVEEGNKIIGEIHKKYRVPVVVFSGTPQYLDEDKYGSFVKVFEKGPAVIPELINYLTHIYKTGITKIMGGQGQLEETMKQVFWNNITPQLNSWIKYTKDGIDTEKALLRYTINHLTELLSESDTYFIEEAFISPPISGELKTGSIINETETKTNYIVLSPACDIEIRDTGTCNTDRILICEIEPKSNKDLGSSKNNIHKIIRNNSDHLHWLPQTNDFPGGCVNFRYVHSVGKETIKTKFDTPKLQVTHHFIKDIAARFSSYYARQGQPDFNFKKLADEIERLNSN